MRPINQQVVLVTGASSGIGEATAIRLRQRGFIVYAAARRTARMRHLLGLGIHVLALDVTDDASLKQALQVIMQQQKRLDILINNAGFGTYGAIEEVPLADGRRQFDVNVFGAVRLIQLVLPIMRCQRSGRIINTSSIAAKVYEPLSGWYMGTKHALEGISDSLRTEVAAFGIDVVMIEPGATNSQWAGIAKQALLRDSGSGAYQKLVWEVAAQLDLFAKVGSAPTTIADLMERAATARRPRTRYVGGFGSKTALFARRLLSDRQFDAAVALILGLGYRYYQRRKS
ncbi:oxidoreductase [Loigolactobacillus rennini]|uniref:Short chain dehydrogenase n=1 Tax=Loigolactobacillus rennini DSM 20253 TaxID=1423796 RepID=A0A0R2DDK2_9LACO|nr:oxidoreductase [Loigolactobacillus rennini]KRM99876.1 short chain dehydrogenase [Loigolactobacillus rennini DSM 20253]